MKLFLPLSVALKVAQQFEHIDIFVWVRMSVRIILLLFSITASKLFSLPVSDQWSAHIETREPLGEK